MISEKISIKGQKTSIFVQKNKNLIDF